MGTFEYLYSTGFREVGGAGESVGGWSALTGKFLDWEVFLKRSSVATICQSILIIVDMS